MNHVLHPRRPQHRSVERRGRCGRSSPNREPAEKDKQKEHVIYPDMLMKNDDVLIQQMLKPIYVSHLSSYQWEIVRVNPDDAEVGVVGVLTSHFLQDFKELKTV